MLHTALSELCSDLALPLRAGCSASGWTPRRLRGYSTCSMAQLRTAPTSTMVRCSQLAVRQRECMLDRQGVRPCCKRVCDPWQHLHIPFSKLTCAGSACFKRCLVNSAIPLDRRRVPLRTADQPLRGARRLRVSRCLHSTCAPCTYACQHRDLFVPRQPVPLPSPRSC